MAYYMENDKKAANPIKSIIGFFRLITMAYGLLTLVYWLIYTAGIEGLEVISGLFQPVFDIVGTFYHHQANVNGENIDFTGLVAAICLVLLSNFIKSLEQTVGSIGLASVNNKKTKRAANVGASSVSAVKKVEKDLTHFVFLLDIKLTNVSNFIQESKISMEEMDSLKTKFYDALLNNLNHNQIIQKGYFKKKLYIIYKDFDYVDNFVFYTKETLNSLSREFTRPTLKIDFLVGLSSLSNLEELKKEVNLLDTVICLNINNEFITTAGFKAHYDDKVKKQYKLNAKGIYNLSKNLNVADNQEIFTIRENTDY